jgi:limonene 1,2-monooxygenase
MAHGPKRFGMFLAPFHSDDEHPSLQLRRDIDLVEHLDRLGYEEAWIGEHHSGSYEIIGSPEVFIAAAAERTRRIRLGTGVSSLSYHHPLMLAERMCQLDQQTLGRTMLGVGPGQLPMDAFMMGIDPVDQRRRMHESLGAMIKLLRGEVVTESTDWYELSKARLQLLPYDPSAGLEIAVASTFSPSGASLAGKHGVGLLSVAASTAQGADSLTTNWEVCQTAAGEHGTSVDRKNWRVVVPMHIAETREQAEADVAWGILKFVRYFAAVGGKHPRWGHEVADALDRWRTKGFGPLGVATIGTPADAIERIEQLADLTGGFGTFLLLAHNTADPDATFRSYELFARHVVPHFTGANAGRHASLDWTFDNAQRFGERANEAVNRAYTEHEQRHVPTDQTRL